MTKSFASRTLLHTPSVDVAEFTDQLAFAWGVTCGEPVSQYLAWSDKAGLFRLIAAGEPMTLEEISAKTALNRQGADALLCILASLKLVKRINGKYSLSDLGMEYFVAENPYYIGTGLYLDCDKDIPEAYLCNPTEIGSPMEPGGGRSWDIPLRLRVQHSRNFAPSVAAARKGKFDQVRHLVDIAGGSGVLAIPLALDHPEMRITLVERPSALSAIHEILSSYGVERRIELCGLDVLNEEWRFGDCDGIFFGNFFHASNDDECRLLCRKSYTLLPPGARISLHEVLFDENRDGPLIAALWNANMIRRRSGARQRTASELIEFLRDAGFEDCLSMPTAGRFWLVSGRKSVR
jgi:hypothetical protein